MKGFSSKIMRKLNDDMVLEVILRLPLKEAIRCKSINKNFHTCISRQQHEHFVQSIREKYCTLILHCSEANPMLFGQVRLDPPYLSNYLYLHLHEHLPIQVQVMASCGGLLFLHFKIHDTYGLFNPITGEFQLVPNNDQRRSGSGPIGLAVDPSTQSCRLVAVDVELNLKSREKKVFKFSIFSAISCTWEKTHQEDLVCDQSYNIFTNTLPVFLHNSMHWLTKVGDILAFDLEKRVARIIKRPIDISSLIFEYDLWFGGVQDSLVFVCSSKYEIVIYVYDFVQRKWRILHTIVNINGGEFYGLGNGIPMLFNGKQLVILIRNLRRERLIYLHDVSNKSWEEIGKIPAMCDLDQRYVPFVPTLAKLYSGNLYLHDSTLNSDIRGSLDGLHQLLEAQYKTIHLHPRINN